MAFQQSFKVLQHFKFAALNTPALSAFAALGGLTAAYVLYHFISFACLHLFHRSKLDRYKNADGSASWVLITGSSDGLGRGYAEEFCERGFNVILHGRNPSKLDGVKADLLRQWPKREVQILVLDAAVDVEDSTKMDAVAERFKDLNLRILVNNIAGNAGLPRFAAHAKRSAEDNRKLMNTNLLFTLEITRVLLPLLIKDKPATILNIGSRISRMPSPYTAMIGGPKAFLESFSHTLAAEMIAEGHAEVDVQHILVGPCSTANEPKPVTFWVPSSRQFVKSSLGVVGSGYRTLWGCWPHAVQVEAMFLLPMWVLEKLCTHAMKKLLVEEDEVRMAESNAKEA